MTIDEYKTFKELHEDMTSAIYEASNYLNKRAREVGLRVGSFYTDKHFHDGDIDEMNDTEVFIKWTEYGHGDWETGADTYLIEWLTGPNDERVTAMDKHIKQLMAGQNRSDAAKKSGEIRAANNKDKKEFERLKEKFGET